MAKSLMSEGVYQVNQMRKNYPVKIVPHKEIPVEGSMLLRKHWHRSIEIIFAWNGSLELWVNGISRVIADEIVIINNGEIHGIPKFYPGEQDGCSVLIAYTFLKELNPKIDQLWFEAKPGLKENEKLKEALLRITKIYQEEKDWYNLEIRSVMYEIIYLLFTEYVQGKNETTVKSLKTAEAYKEIITYLNEHYMENVKLKDTAAYFGYNVDYFSRNFKNYIGETFTEYLKRLRLYNAHKQLVWTDKPILNIAMDNGFADSKAFIRDFKEHFGMTPLKYRKAQVKEKIINDPKPEKKKEDVSENIS